MNTPCIEGVANGPKGYTRVEFEGKRVLGHRLAYAQAHGLDVFTMGGVVLHACDNPRCINPQHLSLGTHADNVADMVGKKRNASGEQHGSAVLTADDARQIRALYVKRHPDFDSNALSRRFGVSPQTVRKVISGKIWKEA